VHVAAFAYVKLIWESVRANGFGLPGWNPTYLLIQYNTILLSGTKNTDATEDITREKKLNSIAYWKRQEDEYFLSYFMIAEKHKFH